MKPIRFYPAFYLGKAAYFALKLLKRNASYFPGKLALTIYPDVCKYIEKPEKIIAVTGTNGKTTSCNLALGILEKNGYRVLNNRYGSNINAGVASSLISGSTMRAKAKYDLALFEVDERSSKLVYDYIKPDYLLCTNLFRDSIRRNAHTEFIFNFINSALPEKTALILNADDGISCRLGNQNKKIFFSVNQMAGDSTVSNNIVNDMSVCPVCGEKLTYSFIRYSHIGRFTCTGCGYRSPEPDVTGYADLAGGKLTVNAKDGSFTTKLINETIYNIYNEVAVSALLMELGLEKEKIADAFNEVTIVRSRHSKKEAAGMTVETDMAKGLNPVACSCVFDSVSKAPGTKEVILILCDAHDAADTSENVSWLYDTDFEFLNNPDIHRIIVGGVRYLDTKLRLLIAGIPEEKIVCTSEEYGTVNLLKYDCESVFILHDLTLNDLALKMQSDVIQKLENGAKEAAK